MYRVVCNTAEIGFFLPWIDNRQTSNVCPAAENGYGHNETGKEVEEFSRRELFSLGASHCPLHRCQNGFMVGAIKMGDVKARQRNG
jgi:hypothetical protein